MKILLQLMIIILILSGEHITQSLFSSFLRLSSFPCWTIFAFNFKDLSALTLNFYMTCDELTLAFFGTSPNGIVLTVFLKSSSSVYMYSKAGMMEILVHGSGEKAYLQNGLIADLNFLLLYL